MYISQGNAVHGVSGTAHATAPFGVAPEVVLTESIQEAEEYILGERDQVHQDQHYLLDLDPIVFYSDLPQSKPIGMIRLGRAEWRDCVFGEFTETSRILETRDGLRSVADWWTDDAR